MGLLVSAVHKVGTGAAVRAVDTDTAGEMPSVVVIFEEISGAGGEGWAVTLDVTDTVTGTLLKEACGKLLVKSGLGVEDRAKAEVTGGLVTKPLIDDVVLGVSIS